LGDNTRGDLTLRVNSAKLELFRQAEEAEMGSRIWEHVAANQLQKGDVLSWHYMPGTDGIPDDSFRVRVLDVTDVAGPEPLPYVRVAVVGPDGPFERMSTVSTGRTYRQGDAVRRMKREHAARVSDTNLRSVVR
jgi:hypothetical protein